MTTINETLLKDLLKQFKENTPSGSSHNIIIFQKSALEWIDDNGTTEAMIKPFASALGIDGGLDKDILRVSAYYSGDYVTVSVDMNDKFTIDYRYDEEKDDE